MIDYETFCQIRQRHDQKGLKVSQIAQELKLDPKTVDKWIDQTPYLPRQTARRPSKLDPFKGQIIALLERHPYTAQQILQQLRQQGYAGAYSILKELVRQARPPRKPAFLRLDFAPAECAQVDWGQYGSIQVGSTRRPLSFFVMVLCCSRLMSLEFTLSETMEQFLSCHRHALEFFGGSTSQVMIDNLKVGVVRHPSGEKALFNPPYLDFAAHYGFEPVACNVGKGNEKGRVENGVGYVKKNLLSGLEISSSQTLLLAFFNLCPRAQLFYRKLQDKRLNAPHHARKIVALSEIYGPDKVARAIDDAIGFEAFGCEYVANILMQRERVTATPAALHLTRRQDLLDLDIPLADLDLYERKLPSNPS